LQRVDWTEIQRAVLWKGRKKGKTVAYVKEGLPEFGFNIIELFATI
jgi:hypothetical protein